MRMVYLIYWKTLSSNSFVEIPVKSSIFIYIKNIVNIYFKNYYALAIETLRQIDQNYSNLIENQILTLKILSRTIEEIN